MRASLRRTLLVGVLVALAAGSSRAQQLPFTPLNKTGVYQLGEPAGWSVSLPRFFPPPTGDFSYTIKANNAETIATGKFNLSSGEAKIEVQPDRPMMLYAEVTPPSGRGRVVLGAAVAPDKLAPVVPAPADFDKFWQDKLAALRAVPPNAVLTPGNSGRDDVEYATIAFDQLDGRHIRGQIAVPKAAGKHPALLILQWASPPYPLQREWVVSRAAQGFICLNIEPHDVLPAEPPSYYAALPDSLKHYERLGADDRDKSHFLYMYLGAVRAVEYLAGRPDWDGKTLIANGISMGGQQSLAVAGLAPQVTHVIVDVPAGCDLNAALHGRQAGYPFFPADNPRVMETARYFDVVNFAPRIKARALVAMGFIDTVCPPAGVWTAYNLIPGAKEVVPLVESPHNHHATPAQQYPYFRRAEEWLAALAQGEDIPPAPTEQPVYDDHRQMMDQLGIKALRPGANPNDQSTYDEAEADRYLDSLPDALTMNDGTKVKSADQWPARRAEILEHFEREVYGRIPPGVPPITWQVVAETPGEVRIGGPADGRPPSDDDNDDAPARVIPTVTKTLVGHIDNSAFPNVNVDVQATITVPAGSDEPRPLILLFGFGGGFFGRPRPGTIPWTDQAIAHGWAHGTIVPTSIQPDNNNFGAGVIGLTNRDQPRPPDQWGALRAWAWGVSRLIDYFETHPDAGVDPKKVGIAGLSRYGKAALVTQAFEERIAVGLIGSSGEGGAKLHRHQFGERVENLTGGGGYHWMAGNFLKYGAEDAAFGRKTAADLPVDQHELIAACAPRPCFISTGTIEGGDPHWIDVRGTFMAGVLAGPVYRLLGKQDFGTPGDFRTDAMPAVGQLIGGELAWRQHEGGHDLTPNWPAFFECVGKYIEAPPVGKGSDLSNIKIEVFPMPTAAPSDDKSTQSATTSGPAVTPIQNPKSKIQNPEPLERTDPNSRTAHQQLLAKAKQGRIDVYFLGDSITRRWGCTDPQYADFMKNWRQNFFGWNAANFGWGGDSTQNILWRIANGELDGVNPKVIVLLAGTNDVSNQPPADAETKAAEVAARVKAILDVCREKAPEATIILTAVFPRNDNMAVMPVIDNTNALLSKFADGKRIRFLNVNDRLADADGKLHPGMMGDGLHPALAGYQVWADGLKPIFTELLGAPAQEDHAPPPTGDPSISK